MLCSFQFLILEFFFNQDLFSLCLFPYFPHYYTTSSHLKRGDTKRVQLFSHLFLFSVLRYIVRSNFSFFGKKKKKLSPFKNTIKKYKFPEICQAAIFTGAN